MNLGYVKMLLRYPNRNAVWEVRHKTSIQEQHPNWRLTREGQLI